MQNSVSHGKGLDFILQFTQFNLGVRSLLQLYEECIEVGHGSRVEAEKTGRLAVIINR